jgi:hypothetical protein
MTEPIDVGNRKQLFLDDLLVDQLVGNVKRVYHSPQTREIVMTLDRPWEGNTCGHVTVCREDDIYRMTYRGSGYTIHNGVLTDNHRHFICYAGPSHKTTCLTWTMDYRRIESKYKMRSGTALTDTLLMWSRDGTHFTRAPETFLRPGPQRSGTWMYGDSWVGWHMVETPSDLPDAPPEM